MKIKRSNVMVALIGLAIAIVFLNLGPTSNVVADLSIFNLKLLSVLAVVWVCLGRESNDNK